MKNLIIVSQLAVFIFGCNDGSLTSSKEQGSPHKQEYVLKKQGIIPTKLGHLYDKTLIKKDRKKLLDPSDLVDNIGLFNYGYDKPAASIDIKNFKSEIKRLRKHPDFFEWCLKPMWTKTRSDTFEVTSSNYCVPLLEAAAIHYPNDEELYDQSLLDLSQYDRFKIGFWIRQLAANNSVLLNKFHNVAVKDQPSYIQAHIGSGGFMSIRDNYEFLGMVYQESVPYDPSFAAWVDKLPLKERENIYHHIVYNIFYQLDDIDGFKLALQFSKYGPDSMEKRIDGLLYAKGSTTTNGKTTHYVEPLLFKPGYESYHVISYLFNTYVKKMPQEEKQEYMKNFAILSKHPIGRAIDCNLFNPILAYLAIETNPEMIERIYLDNEKVLKTHPKSYEIVQAFVIRLMELKRPDIARKYFADIALEIIAVKLGSPVSREGKASGDDF